MIVAAAFCPHPPLLVPEVAQNAAAELDDLRSACRAAITRVAASGARLLVIGPGPVSASHRESARGSFAGFGVPLEVGLGPDGAGPAELPLSLTVGAWLLQDALGPARPAEGLSIGPEDDVPAPPRWVADPEVAVALLVMGDGSARRSTAAPGYFDERAEAFDAAVATALRSGAPERLSIDAGLGDELLASGPRAWNAAAGLFAGGPYRAELLYDAAPYGVGYLVAAWTRSGGRASSG